jgi:hypothetical protein
MPSQVLAQREYDAVVPTFVNIVSQTTTIRLDEDRLGIVPGAIRCRIPTDVSGCCEETRRLK